MGLWERGEWLFSVNTPVTDYMKNSISSLNSAIIEVFLFHRRKKNWIICLSHKRYHHKPHFCFSEGHLCSEKVPHVTTKSPPRGGRSLLKCYFIPRELVSLLRYEEDLKPFQEELNTATCYFKTRPCLETPAIKNICCLCTIERATPT